MLTELTLGFGLKLLLVVLHLLAKHGSAILVLHLDIVLQLRQLRLILAFFLPFELQNFTICLFLHLTPGFLKFALKVAL